MAKTVSLAIDVAGVVSEIAERFDLDLPSKIVMFHYDEDRGNGIGTEKYLENAARKIGLLVKNYPQSEVALMTFIFQNGKQAPWCPF